ncbi:MAG: glycosyltransferase family 39 protein [Anaerolineales bacterium]
MHTGRGLGLFRGFFLLPAIEALLAIALIFFIPSEGNQASFLGLSLVRWVFVAGLLALGLLCTIFFWMNQSRHKDWPVIEKVIQNGINHPSIYRLLIAIALFLSVGGFYLLLLTFKFTDEFMQPLLLRVFPLVLWLFLLSVQTLVFFPRLRFRTRQRRTKTWLPVLIALGAIALIAIFMGVTGLGLQPDRTGWENPGVPLLAIQIFFAWVGAGLLYALIHLLEKRFEWRFSRGDQLAAVVLWLLAIWVWQTQPLTPTYFSPTPRPPNAELYPYSDAATHDLAAQKLLIGEGFGDVVEKPLYSFFLAGLHTLVGQDYANVVAAQVVVLALFPALLYFLAGQLHHRFSGAILAVAIIYREANTINLSGEINVSHSKLLMTDLPAALGMALLVLLLLRWLESDRRLLRWPLWVGAALGAFLLLRSQIIIFLPLLLLLAFWRGGKLLRTRALYAGLFLLGFALTAVPWMWRNYQHTGQFGYSQPLQALYLAKQYSLTPEEADPGFPEGTRVSEYVSLGFSRVLQFTFSHPDVVVRFASAHFFHNELSSFLALPMRFDLADKAVTFYNLRPFWIGSEGRLWEECCSLNSYLSDTPYWQNWDGIIPDDAWLPIFVNTLIVSVGFLAAWRKVGWLTLVPVGVHVFYNFSTAVARVSGWRLILPVDWVLLLFYCLGLGQLTLWAWTYFFGANLAEPALPSIRSKSRVPGWRQQKLPVLVASLLFAGLLLPVAEIAVPARYADLDTVTAEVEWQSSQLAEQTGLDLSAFLGQPGAVQFWGRALYPRFYAAGTGEPGGDGTAFNIQPFARLAFWVVGQGNNQVALPLASPPVFPNAVDVMVLGCAHEKYFRAAAVVFLEGESTDLLSDDPFAFLCSPTASP